jgi:hypothetical protein
MEWSVTEVLRHPDTPDTVPGHLPMPRWSWDGLVV